MRATLTKKFPLKLPKACCISNPSFFKGNSHTKIILASAFGVMFLLQRWRLSSIFVAVKTTYKETKNEQYPYIHHA